MSTTHTRPVTRRRPTLRPSWHAVPWAFGAGVVGVQIAFPLTGGGTPTLTVLAVALFAAASVSHALLTRGPAAAVGLVVVAGGGGLLVEAVGLATGVPFGEYRYTGTLGPEVLGVPVVVPLAWAMMAYPSLVVGRRLAAALGRGRGAVTVLGAWALATWDVFLDPQMVEAGHWYWLEPWPTLPGVPGIPVSNFAGWLLVALLMIAALDRVVPAPQEGDDRLPLTLWCWTFLSSTMAAAVFFGRPSVALVGGVLMGLVGVPLLVVLRRHGART
ncbi:carotenoid biosynthesis protein [Actinomycetospora straminea]|uniref:Carotenoid biosynthesis protein n=1 Tax=Actinomycetospora straminea TaxID=663607 RepID=A0ABP9FCH9_9PSEU|nr:carotenoid biosynthesis protein [Actinomycetospora straminea]MDD7936136.1 carotenoid biosynthesis protein [Actinomycetospora straminea]